MYKEIMVVLMILGAVYGIVAVALGTHVEAQTSYLME